MQEKYLNYSTNDFITDEYFHQWVVNADATSNAFWESFIEQFPQKADDIAQAISFIRNLNFSTDYPDSWQTEESLKQNLEKIRLLQKRTAFTKRSAWMHKPFVKMAAAAVLISIIIFTAVRISKPESMQIVVLTGSSQIKNVLLPDSSIVVLNENSRLAYTSHLDKGGTREVWLQGEAFFNIRKKDDQTRFIVHSSDINVEVLGTTFNVKKKNQLTNVTLNTGKIRISLNKDPSTSVDLNPGDFMQYSAEERKIVKKQVKPDLYSVWKDQKYVMDNIPLREIAQYIEDTYGYEVKITDPELANSKLSGSLRSSDEATLFSTIEFVLDVKISKKDNELNIQPKHKIK